MEWNKESINEIVFFINKELALGRTMISIEREEFGENERVIHKRLIRLGYKKNKNQYEKSEHITSNITPKMDTINSHRTREDITGNITPIEIIKPPETQISGIKDIDKLNLLLENVDKLLKLIPTDITSNITGNRSGKNDVRSLRIDTGLYEAVKIRALRDNINIADLVNKALEDYLNNYL